MTTTIAIVGANLAGGRAAQSLRAEGFGGSIHLIGSERHPPYERPVLSKEVLLGQCEPTKSYLQSEASWAEQDVSLHLGMTVRRIRPADRELELSDGQTLRADKVLLCTGGRVRRLNLPGADLPGVTNLRTIDEANEIRAALTAGASVIVIGGGFIGAEVAASARKLGCQVTWLEAGEVPLQRVLGATVGQAIANLHQDQGVRVLPATTVTRIEGDTRVRQVVTTAGERIAADLVVVGIGIVPNTELAQSAGAAVKNGVLVDSHCETSIPGLYAAGDVANHINPIFGERVRLEQWQNAHNQAAVAAACMLGGTAVHREVPWFWSDQYDVGLQMSGCPTASDSVVVRGDASSHSFSAFFVRNGTLRGVVGVNRPRDVKRTMAVVAAQQPIDPRLLADESFDLRTLTTVGV